MQGIGNLDFLNEKYDTKSDNKNTHKHIFYTLQMTFYPMVVFPYSHIFMKKCFFPRITNHCARYSK